MDIFVPIRFKTSIQLSPSDLVADFEQVILDKVRSSLEGVCSRYGYIRPGSILIMKRSIGTFVKQHFNGHIKFEMICKAEVCNPAIGSVFQATVKNKNALGIHAESIIQVNDTVQPVLDIIIPKRSAGISSSVDLENVKVGDVVNVEVLGKRYQLHDKRISIIGRAIQDVPTPTSEEIVLPDDDEVLTSDPIINDADTLEDEVETEDDDGAKSTSSDESGETADDNAYVQKGGDDDDDEIEQNEEAYEEEVISEDALDDEEDDFDGNAYDEY